MKLVFGANYFPGWWDGPENYWTVDGRFILDAHPERTPLLGATATPALLAREAEVAQAHGITFFNFLWYGTSIQTPLETSARTPHEIAYFNSALESFLRISGDTPLRFSFEWTNHFPWCEVDEAIWRRLVDRWLPIFANPAYMTIDGRLLFKIHSWHCWATTGLKRDRRRQMIQYLRDTVFDHTGKKMLLGTGVRRMESVVDLHPVVQERTFDFTSIYLDVPNMVPDLPDFVGPGRFTYEDLEATQAVGRAMHAYDHVPFVPNVVVGWNPVAAFQADLPHYDPPSGEQFAAAIGAALKDVRRYRGLRFPADAAEPTALLLIYAWNEFGEGGFLAPSRAFGTRYLEVLRSITRGDGDWSAAAS